MIYPEIPKNRGHIDDCPKCKSNEFVRKEGKYKMKSGGQGQRYYCNKCRYWFQRSPRKRDKIRPKCPGCGAEEVYSEGKRRFGGKEYLEAVERAFERTGCVVRAPFEGLGIGERM